MVVDEQVSFFDCWLVRLDPEQFDKQTEQKTTWHFYFWAEKSSWTVFQGEEKKHGEEINFLKRTNQQLKAQLEGIISQKK